MAKTLIAGDRARDEAVKALTEIANAVATTLGPTGLPAIIDQKSIGGELYPTVTKDGVSCINAMSFVDPIYHAVWTFAKSAATHSVIDSGDGTTSTVVLAAAIARMIRNNKSLTPQLYARKIARLIDQCCDQVRSMALKSAETTRQVAFTSCNGDQEIADIAIQAIGMASGYGTIIIEKNVMSRDRYKVVRQEGYQGGRGYRHLPPLAISVNSVAGSNAPFTMSKPYVLLYNGELHEMRQIEPAVKALADATGTRGFNLVCFAYDFWDDLGYKIIEKINTRYPNVKVMLSKTRQTAEVGAGLQTMLDISAITGATVLDGGSYETVTFEQLGTCSEIEFTSNQTVLKGRSPKNTIVQRIQDNLMGAQYARSEVDKDQILARNAELSEGLVTVVVGGGHMASIQERADRMDDAIKAAQAAKRGGAVPGCGATYIKAAQAIESSPEFVEALSSVNRAILVNYGLSEELVPTTYNDGETCRISENGLEYGDFITLGVADACDTVCSVLKNGSELGILCATTGCAVLTTDLEKLSDMRLITDTLKDVR